MKRWPLHKAYFWETAPFFRILLPFAAGILWYDAAWPRIPAGSYCLLIAISAFLLFILCSRNRKDIIQYAAFAALNTTLLFGGLSVAYYCDVRNDATWFGRNLSTSKACLACITAEPAEKEHTWKLPVALTGNIDSGTITRTSGKAFLYLYKDRFPVRLHKGDTILLPGKWQPIKNAGNPFEFDYARYCRRNNIFFQQFCSANDIRLYATHDPASVSITDATHNYCMEQLATYLPDAKTRGLIQAMLLGDEVNLDEELLQSYSETGIVHIIAISGGNVAIFFIAVSFLLLWLRNKRHLWIKYAVALPLVWFYVVMAGAPPSAIRAAVMFSLLAGGVMLQKSNNSLNQLFATAFLLLCAQPMWLFSVGFQLSFVAVLSLILFYAPVYKWLSPAHALTRALWSPVAASISAEVLVAPLVVYYFHTFPLFFVVANVLAYLFMGFVLYLGMAIIALSAFPAIATFFGTGTILLVTNFNKIVGWLQSCNPASFKYLMLTGAELVLLYFFIGGLLLFFLKKQKPALFTGVTAASLLLLSLCISYWHTLHQQRLVIYNTGKANHIELISGLHYSVLYKDTGLQKKADYAVRPSHIGWRAWRQDSAVQTSDIWSIGTRRVLVLNGEMAPDTRFHTDYLIINFAAKPDARALQQMFSPQMTIIGNNYSLRQQAHLKKMFDQAGMPVHCVGLDGAFVVE